jgi:DNA-binding LacI/PurR family transcriptional regulator/DNA-binding transcriptional regulator YhcF (GntR family)
MAEEELMQYLPRYRVIANELRQKIRDGNYLSNEKIPSEHVLGKLYEVSRGTVREALGLLTQEHLLLRQPGVGTIVAPRQKSLHKTTFVFTHSGAYSLTQPYLNRLYHSFEDAVEEFSLESDSDFSVQSVRLAKVANDYGYSIQKSEDVFQDRLCDPKHVQGLCLTASVPDKEVVALQNRGIICVHFSGAEDSKCPSIYFDRYKMRELALLHLKDLGHRKIGFVLAEETKKIITPWPEVMTRLKKTAGEIGLDLDDQYNVYCSDWKRELSTQGVKKLLQNQKRPTALICGDDILAMGAWDGANEMGISVPGDLSIVGFGDYISDANLTTIQLPLEQMGRVGAEILFKGIRMNNDGPDHICLGGYKLIPRASSGLIRESND